MAMRSFGPGLAVDKVTGKGVPVTVAKVLNLDTGDPVDVFDPEDTVNARLLTTNQAGYFSAFMADADRLQVTFGGVTLFLEALELYTALKADAVAAQTAAANSQAAAEAAAAGATAPTDETVAAKVADPASQTRAALDVRYPKKGDLAFNVKDYGAKGDGTTDDTTAIANAIAAAHAASTTLYLPAVVWFPAGTFITGTIDLGTNRVVLQGAGAQTCTIKAKAGTTDYLVKVGTSWGAKAPNNLWRPRMGGFRMQGLSAAAAGAFAPRDTAAAAPGGMKLDNVGSVDLYDVAFREFGGPNLWLNNVVLSRFSNLVLNRPVGADTNAVPYFYSLGWTNENAFNDFLFQSATTAADGPAVVLIDMDGALSSMNQGRWSGTQFEFMHTPIGGAIWDSRASTSMFVDSLYEDCVTVAGASATGTSVMRFRTNSAGQEGGNVVRGTIPGNLGNYNRGVLLEQSGNTVDGARGYLRWNVEIGAGVNNSTIRLASGPGNTNTFADSVIDNSGVTTNTVYDTSIGTGHHFGGKLLRFGDTLRNYFITLNTAGDVNPLVKLVGKVAGASILWLQPATSPTQPYINFIDSTGATSLAQVNRYAMFQAPRFTTAGRPAASTAGAGACYYDTTLSKPVWSDGTAWRDAAGTAV
ncbi:MAG: hypothetical protein HOP99_00700 [Dermatophilaceae bacterium]|nr:hypothetical protein [Dermatophilaceae bacterium]